MGNSYAIQKNVSCENCGNNNSFEVWQIVDAEERPDLVERIKNGILHDAFCLQCKKLIIQIDSPLLVYRQDSDPVFLFSKSEETTDRQDNEILQNLLTKLQHSLGSNWPRDWKDHFFPPLPSRTVMPIFLREGGEAAVLALIQYQKQNNESRKQLAGIISAYIYAKSIREIKTLLNANFPELTSHRAIGVINEVIESRPADKFTKTVITRKHLLLRYREIGLQRALKELDELILESPEKNEVGGNFFSNLFNIFSNSETNGNQNLPQSARKRATLSNNNVSLSSDSKEKITENPGFGYQQYPEKVQELINLLKEKNASAPISERLSEEQLLKIAYRLIGDYKSAGEDSQSPAIKMLFTKFEIDSQEGYSFQEDYGSKLRFNLVSYENTQIFPAGQFISQQDGSPAARNFGKQNRVDIIVWGGYSSNENKNCFRLNIETLTNRQFSNYKTHQISRYIRQFGNISSFYLIQDASGKSTSLISFLEGLVLFQNSSFQQAIECFTLSLTEPDWLDKPSNQSISYFYRGLSLVLLNRPDSALEDFNKALEISPNNMIRIVRANTFALAEKPQNALDDFAQAIKSNPKDPRPFFNRGILFSDNRNSEKAIEDFSQAIRLVPNDALAYLYRGLGYGDLQNHKKAYENFSKAIELNPKCAEAYNNRGTTYTIRGEFEKSIPDFSQAILLDPNDEDSFAKRGQAYRKTGDYDKAIADCTRAIELDPSRADTYTHRGFSYIRKGELTKASADYDKAISIDPNMASAYAERGSIFIIKGELNRAREDLLRASQLNPMYIDLYQSLEKIQK